MTTTAIPSPWLTSHAAAERIGVSVLTIYRATKDGRLPARKTGPRGHLRIHVDDVDALLRSDTPVDEDDERPDAFESLEDSARRIADAPLSDRQRARLRALLGGALG